jgi:hypothetical protein
MPLQQAAPVLGCRHITYPILDQCLTMSSRSELACMLSAFVAPHVRMDVKADMH